MGDMFLAVAFVLLLAAVVNIVDLIVDRKPKSRGLRKHAEHVWAMERELGWEPSEVFGLAPPQPRPTWIAPAYLAPMPLNMAPTPAQSTQTLRQLGVLSANDSAAIADAVAWCLRTRVPGN